MSSFISALLKQRKDAKKAGPDTSARFKEITAILKKYNYDDGITPEITVSILEDLGPTFVKIGQIASQQAEYIPAEYADALAKLRSEVAPMDIDTVYSQIEKYLGKPVKELFASFEETPLGSASIAQVHKATLFDGTVVAVKVRRPGIVDTVAQDFALIEKILDKFIKDDTGGLDIKGMIVELENTSKIELDLTNEANYLDRFWQNNIGRAKVESPKCYRELTCEAILTESFVTGTGANKEEYLSTLSDEERERIASLIADNFATQILTDGFYHADPHSGNVLIKEPVPGEVVETAPVSEEGTGNAEEGEKKPPLPEHGIEWIDFGMMGTLSSKQRQTLIDIVVNVVMKDTYALKKTLMQVAHPKGEIDHGAVIDICESICGQYNGADFGDFELGDLLGTILDMLKEQNFKVDPFLTNLSRGIIAAEGTIKTISPKVNILNFFTDKVDTGLDFNLDLEHPEEMNPDIAIKLLQLFNGLTNSSTKTAEALDMLEKGQIRVRTDFSFEEKALSAVSRFTSYAVRGLIIAALIIGSALMCMAAATTVYGSTVAIVLLVVGLFGFALGGFFSWRLYKNMKKEK